MPKVVNVFSRVEEFKDDGFYVFNRTKNIVMCKFCNTHIDWLRVDSCRKHVGTEAHKKKKGEALRIGTPKRQITLEDVCSTSKKFKTDKREFANDLTTAFIEANIPLEKVEHESLRKFFNKHCAGAGDLPRADTLRTQYVAGIGERRLLALKEAVKDKPVVILCDETTDRKGRCIFIVLLRPLACAGSQKVYVGAVKVLENANGTECARAILSVVKDSNIKFENVVSIITDSARYMGVCVDSLKILFSQDMVHVQCWAHKLNLVASMWSSLLPELNAFVTQTKSLFLNTRKRKHRYLSFLNEKYPNGEKKALLFPMPVLTRWTSWYKSADYIRVYAEDLKQFALTLEESSGAVHYFHSLDASEIIVIKASATFLEEHCKPVIDSIVTLEGNSYPYIHKVHGKLQDHLGLFKAVGNGIIGEGTNEVILKLGTASKKSQLVEKLKVLAIQCHTKLSKLLCEDKGKLLILNMGKMFDVRHIITNSVDPALGTLAAKVPILSTLPLKDLVEGYAVFQNQVQQLVDEEKQVDILAVLLGLRESHENFTQASVQALWIPPSNVDSERAFSMYGNVLTDLRTNLKPENLEIMLASCFEH